MMIDMVREELERAVTAAGADWVGVQTGGPHELVLFQSRATRAVLALPARDVTVAAVTAKVQESDARFQQGS